MYDTKLVIAAQEGDEAAFAALFDRNADAVYDLCWALTGDEAEAGRMVENAFVLAARHIDEITDASQVRPWLLAIARDRALTEDEAGILHTAWGMKPPVGAGEEVLGTGDLRRWTREAAATLALADQAVLELSTRHELESDQLAATIGCAPSTVDDVLAQVDREADEVLGSLVVARQGRKDCPALAALLAGWDSAPSVDVAEQVAVHAAGCERCGRRLALAEPRQLVAAAPAVTPPSGLRANVLDRVAPEVAANPGRRAPGEPAPAAVALAAASEAAVALAAASEAPPTALARTVAPTATVAAGGAAYETFAGPPGGPAPPPTPGRAEGDRTDGPPWLIIAAAALAVAVLIAIVALAVRPSSKPKASNTAPTTTAAPQTTAAPAPTAAPLALTPVASTTTPTSTPPTGRLLLDSTNVNLGTTATTAQVLLSNGGPGQVAWKAASGAKWLTVAPASGTLAPNGSVNVTLAVNRSAAPTGPFSVQVAFIATGTGNVSTGLTVTGSQAAPTTTTPATSSTIAAGPQITNVAGSQVGPCQARITATITGPATITSAVVSYTFPGGAHGSAAMSGSGAQWSATVGGWTKAGSLTFSVTASDSGSASVTSPTSAVSVTACA